MINVSSGPRLHRPVFSFTGHVSWLKVQAKPCQPDDISRVVVTLQVLTVPSNLSDFSLRSPSKTASQTTRSSPNRIKNQIDLSWTWLGKPSGALLRATQWRGFVTRLEPRSPLFGSEVRSMGGIKTLTTPWLRQGRGRVSLFLGMHRGGREEEEAGESQRRDYSVMISCIRFFFFLYIFPCYIL